MNAAEYFELVDAVTKIDGKTRLRVVADRIATTSMHPLERRVLERALRARTEALDLQTHLLTSDLVGPSLPESESFLTRG
jgi:hypothetical protein